MIDHRIPTPEALQEVVDAITGGGVRFDALDYNIRATIMQIAVNADIADSLSRIHGDAVDVGAWFRNSRLWEGS